MSADEVVVVDIFTHRKCQCVRVLRAWPDPTISYTKGLGTHVCILNAMAITMLKMAGLCQFSSCRGRYRRALGECTSPPPPRQIEEDEPLQIY